MEIGIDLFLWGCVELAMFCLILLHFGVKLKMR